MTNSMFDIELQIVDCGSQSSRWPSTSHIDLCDQKTNQTSVKMRQLIVLWIFCWVVCVCVCVIWGNEMVNDIRYGSIID